jgi:hypothetical protein
LWRDAGIFWRPGPSNRQANAFGAAVLTAVLNQQT